ncbi:Hypothetical predicted protein [Mytilus galloprovincialis]|uniref:Uncharacterized protein n=1 Tax=Mytilus galloprovincialis TaxID=29158 RepID=A0A8B6GN23_MYTGA|nr:Hypothetical predicted protein [Mytilus galloprovincialis]
MISLIPPSPSAYEILPFYSEKEIGVKSSPGDDRKAGYNETMLESVENQVSEWMINVKEKDGKLEDLEYRANMLTAKTAIFEKNSIKTRKSNKKICKCDCCIIV